MRLFNERLEEIVAKPHTLSHINDSEIQSIAKELLTLRGEVKTLTKERDEARKQERRHVENLTRIVIEMNGVKAELSALKVAPGMEEVDACIHTPKPIHYGVTSIYGPTVYDGKKLAVIARRAIASRDEEKKSTIQWQEKHEDENSERLIVEKERDETVRLLKWIVARTRHGNGFLLSGAATHSGEFGETARRILELVEGK